MGNMVEISILTDGFDQVEKYPKKFVQLINRAMQSYPEDGRYSYGIGNHGNALTIYPFHHADIPKLYLAHRNAFVSLDRWAIEEYLRTHQRDDNFYLDYIEHEVDHAMAMLAEAKAYLKGRERE